MEKRSSSEAGPGSENSRQRPGLWPPVEPFVAKADHNPRELKSWAKRTGFNPNFSGETTVSSVIDEGEEAALPPAPAGRDVGLDLEEGLGRRRGNVPPRVEMEPILGRKRAGAEINPVTDPEPLSRKKGGMWDAKDKERIGLERVAGTEEEKGVGNVMSERAKKDGINGDRQANGVPAAVSGTGDEDQANKEGAETNLFLEPHEPQNPPPYKSGLQCGLTENPGLGHLFFYGIQHYLSMAGSIVFIPLIMVPAMGGTDGETATVISTMLLISGITTIMHLSFGTRLPLVQGSSFVYLAPALVIINSKEYRNLSEDRFTHIMRELQGAIIVGSLFQALVGYSGLMSLILRLINPVVVAPTVTAVGLSFFSYGFPQAGSCVGISIPLIILILIFTLYLRKVSIFGIRIFLVYAVPLSVAIVWAYAFFLTAGGAYNYKGCSSNIPSSNILSYTCRRHALTIRRCRTDVSIALKTAAWVRIPYPFQWGTPTFNFTTSVVMIVVSLVASVDSIGSYHAASLLINLRPPTPGVVSRGVGLEGISSILAGIWGSGAGSTTLTENIHTLDATKMASRRALALGAILLVIFSFVGKVGALLASIPVALAAAVLSFTWALIVALGLSTMQYTQTASSRNMLIVGFTLFISLSVPAYFQQYPPASTLILPSYLVPYAAASDGPINFASKGLNYVLNSLLSLNIVVALLVAFILDNTVPGSRQERGAYIWSSSQNPEVDPSSLRPYLLPEKVGRFFKWAKWIGL
ncbi:Nucleobase-ascorbate transporter 11 [Apostasia shenzhenica]|uniref:Nucleobase-ascorbate transporter 11 n=1 Tax=Apostasia shenzhenica TaxID=1088818 RepID=A0A2H9ZZQ6_9ASPA|nr:Nucleobase-ascorbate transporter 11 [Apostasia shenzhenica]